jgi:hypothetical protein
LREPADVRAIAELFAGQKAERLSLVEASGPNTQSPGSPGSKQTHSHPAEKLCSHFLLDPKTF